MEKKAYVLRIQKELYEIIKKEAERKGQTMHGIIINILWEHFNKGD